MNKEWERVGQTTSPSVLSLGRTALVIAHPSHELRVHGWLERAKPLVFIWTDGSGRSGTSRLEWTTRLLDRAGATRGSIYGRLTDRAVYDAVLRKDHELFISLTGELAGALIQAEIECVVGDASEGHNVTHEVGRLMTGAAVELASRHAGKPIRNLEFLVVGAPDECPEELRPGAVQLRLDDVAFRRKLEAVTAHHPNLAADITVALKGAAERGAGRFTERSLVEAAGSMAHDMSRLNQHPDLAAEIRRLLEGLQIDSFREESLRPVSNRTVFGYGKTGGPPFYEAYGEVLVDAGHYREVIRHEEHIQPLAEALWDHVERGSKALPLPGNQTASCVTNSL